MSSSNGSQGRELYVGLFPTHYWTAKSLCGYFHRLIEGSSITDYHFYPCTSVTKPKSVQNRVLVKRNLREIPKDQRAICQYITIHLEKFDPLFTAENVLAYFGAYGSIKKWKSVDGQRMFLLMFDDTDSVDRILLDRPHLVNEKVLSIEKCYHPYSMGLTDSTFNPFEEKRRSLRAELTKLSDDFQDDLRLAKKQNSEANDSFLQVEKLERDLKDKLIDAQRVQEQLKEQIEQTLRRNAQLKAEYTHQLDRQKVLNQRLRTSLFSQSLSLSEFEDALE